MIFLFLAAVYCLVDAFLIFKFDIRLRPAHFFLRPENFWSSGKTLVPLFVLASIALWIFPFLSVSLILLSKWPHPFLIALQDFWQKRPHAHFPLSTHKTQGKKLFDIPTEDKPHIIFIVLESFRAKNVGCLGATVPLSPHFDRLAQKGILFTNFHSTGNLTNRSIIASLFGLPPAHRPWHLGYYCDLPLIGLPQILARHGYHPAVIQGGSTSFDHEAKFFENQGFKTILGKRDIDQSGTSWGVFDEHLMPYAASWLSQQSQPVFLNLTTITNHHPWMHPNGESGYFQTFAYTDWALNLFVEDLKKRELLQKSILFIFGDHGQELADRDPHFAINRHLYQDNIHVPLLVYAEKRQKHTVIDTVASQIDLLPTVLDLLHLTDPHHSLGKSLLRASTKPIFFSHPFDTPIRGCREGKWKYLIQESGEELYDLSADPEERVNRVGEKDFIPCAVRNDVFDKASAPGLQQRSGAAGGHVKDMADAGGCKDGDVGEVKDVISDRARYKQATLDYFDSLNAYYSDQPQQKKEGRLHLDLSNTWITDADLEKLHPELASLSLAHCLLLTNAGIGALLRRCPKLEKLTLDGLDEITGIGWNPAPHLVHLKAFDCPKMKIHWIQQLPSLMILQLGSADITDDDLLSLPQTHLTTLYLSNLQEITDRGLKPLLDANLQLMIIHLKECPQITRAALASSSPRMQF